MTDQPNRTKNKPQDQRVKRTYRELIKALEELLCETTLEQMTVKRLCDAAQIQRTTFYQHFQDMQDFLEWYILQKQNEFHSLGTGSIPREKVSDVLIELAKSIMNYLKNNEKLVKNMMNTQINGKPLFDLYVSTCVEDLMRRLENVPELEKRAGNTPVQFLAEYYVGGMIAVFRWWIMHDKPYSEEEFLRYLNLRIERMRRD